MAIKKRNGDVAVLITRSPSGHKALNYQRAVKKWTDEDWVLIDEFPKGSSLAARGKSQPNEDPR